MILRRALPLLFIISLPLFGWAQGLIQVGIPHDSDPDNQKVKKNSNARTMAISLPFWEDFSSTKTTYADPKKFLYGRSVRINDGMAIQPPSLKVATFDGIDSVGAPYNVNDVLAKGYADKLVSNDIDLTTVDAADRSNVWMSYMYQMKGNGEIPDAGDRLLVLFFDKNLNWIPVDTIENDGTQETNIFYTSFIQISDDRYYHPAFKFRIQNFARLSGPYDTWHVDYIYINKGRVKGTDSYTFVPDRTISEPASSLLGVYRSIPVDHFLLKASDIATNPNLVTTNLNPKQPKIPNVPSGQPMKPITTARIAYRVGENTTELPMYGPEDPGDAGGAPVAYNEFVTFNIQKIPDLASIAESINNANIVPDSLGIYLELGMNTDDNHSVFDLPPGDYDPNVFVGLDFRSNDTIRATYTLTNKYAYDDGGAEYGAGLNQPGAQVAYKYELIGAESEDITFLEMYFPRFGDESSQLLELRIWNDFHFDPIYREVTTLQRSQDNKFWKKRLTEPVHVGKVFYVGWKQTASAVIAVGLDKNNDTGDRIYSNVTGVSTSWQQNEFIHGSLMIRPVFGDGGVINGLEDEEKELVVYPNPGSGVFYFNGEAEMISVYDMTGRSIPAMTEITTHETKLSFSNASPGIYIIKAHVNGRVKTAKVMVR